MSELLKFLMKKIYFPIKFHFSPASVAKKKKKKNDHVQCLYPHKERPKIFKVSWVGLFPLYVAEGLVLQSNFLGHTNSHT